jgi:hypothetical protein
MTLSGSPHFGIRPYRVQTGWTISVFDSKQQSAGIAGPTILGEFGSFRAPDSALAFRPQICRRISRIQSANVGLSFSNHAARGVSRRLRPRRIIQGRVAPQPADHDRPDGADNRGTASLPRNGRPRRATQTRGSPAQQDGRPLPRAAPARLDSAAPGRLRPRRARRNRAPAFAPADPAPRRNRGCGPPFAARALSGDSPRTWPEVAGSPGHGDGDGRSGNRP